MCCWCCKGWLLPWCLLPLLLAKDELLPDIVSSDSREVKPPTAQTALLRSENLKLGGSA